MTVYEVDVSSSPVTVTGRNGLVVAEGRGLRITSAEVELIEPGLLAVRDARLEVEVRDDTVHLYGIGDTGGSGRWL